MPKKKQKIFQAPKGMKDVLFEEQIYWEKFRKISKEVAENFNYQRIDTPILEDMELFVRGTGATTDIVQKQMYTLKTHGGHCLALRPENTPGIARAYLENGMANLPQPVKFYYFGLMFRHEQPQAGRWRQLCQFGFEIIGDGDAVLDAQIIQSCAFLLKNLGIKKISVQINSLGCKACRPAWRKALMNYYRYHQESVCVNCRRRLKENPFRLLDCKEEKCQSIKVQAPNAVDYLCDECHQHFKNVLEYLDELEIPYFLNNSIVRGLDYYTKTVFEIFSEDEIGSGLGNALGGGGRYDYLVAMLGGKPTPAVGAALGVDRIINLMKKQNQIKAAPFTPKVFLAQLGGRARKKSLKIFEKLNEAGIKTAESMSRDSIKVQLKIADKLGVLFSLILGQQEALDDTIIIRDMRSGVQETVPQKKVAEEIKKRLAKKIKGVI